MKERGKEKGKSFQKRKKRPPLPPFHGREGNIIPAKKEGKRKRDIKERPPHLSTREEEEKDPITCLPQEGRKRGKHEKKRMRATILCGERKKTTN